jgi:hypothetical protein
MMVLKRCASCSHFRDTSRVTTCSRLPWFNSQPLVSYILQRESVKIAHRTRTSSSAPCINHNTSEEGISRQKRAPFSFPCCPISGEVPEFGESAHPVQSPFWVGIHSRRPPPPGIWPVRGQLSIPRCYAGGSQTCPHTFESNVGFLAARRDAFIDIMSENLGLQLFATVIPGTSGGHAATKNGHVYVISQARNELGCGTGDPAYQSASYYLEFVRKRREAGSVLPCLHLYHAGELGNREIRSMFTCIKVLSSASQARRSRTRYILMFSVPSSRWLGIDMNSN